MDSIERWCPVVGYEGLYEVSNLGRVRSLACGAGTRTRPRPIKLEPSSHGGYLRARLFRPGLRRVTRMVHDLVLESFVGPCPDGQEGAHQNGDKFDNRVENLRWMTHQANIDQRDEHGTTAWGERSGQSKLTADEVREIRERYAAGGETHVSLGFRFGVCKAAISHILNGRNWARLDRAE